LDADEDRIEIEDEVVPVSTRQWLEHPDAHLYRGMNDRGLGDGALLVSG
jgi:hypothetical protein